MRRATVISFLLLLALLPCLVCATYYEPENLPQWLKGSVPAPKLVYDPGLKVNACYRWWDNTIVARPGARTSTLNHEYGHAVWNQLTPRGVETWVRRVTLWREAVVGVWELNPGEAFADAFVRVFIDPSHPYRSLLPEPPAMWTHCFVWVYVRSKMNW